MDPNSTGIPPQVIVSIPPALSALGGIMIVVLQLLRRIPAVENYKHYLPYVAVASMIAIGMTFNMGDLMTLCVVGAAVAGAYDGAKVTPGLKWLLTNLSGKTPNK